jgi:hypothetical protein
MTLSTCIDQRDDNYFILCSDNSWTDDGTTEYLQELSALHGNLTVIRPAHSLAAAAHWEFALNHVAQGYVIVIGDDDALTPHAISTLRKLIDSNHGVGVIQWPLSYYL